MMKREDGFTLVELIITLTMTVLFLTAVSTIFTNLLTQFKQQGKIAESNIEGVIGLEIMRQSIESAGYGLPWDLQGINYNEAVNDPNTPWDDTALNDAPNIPAALRSKPQVSMNGSSDVLSVKSVSVAQNSTSQIWTELAVGNAKKNGLSGSSFAGPELVTVLYATLNSLGLPTRVLIHDKNSNWSATYSNTLLLAPGPDPNGVGASTVAAAYPEIGVANTLSVFILYGIDPGTSVATLRMPFNRADFYVRTLTPANLPARCAPGTGVLYKGVINHSDGTLSELPLLDCVAAMHVTFYVDNSLNNDGTSLQYTGDVSVYDAANIRTRVKEVRVYILAQEGQRDLSYTYPNSNVTLANPLAVPPDPGPSQVVDMTKITNYQNYRWKQYTMVVRPSNLR